MKKSEHLENTRTRIVAAYPSHLRSDVEAVLIRIPMSRYEPSESNIGCVIVGGEELYIPYRVYFPELNENEVLSLSEIQSAIAVALYTRHYDGLVREKFVKQLVNYSHSWVPPFVLCLIGEYVYEIIELLANICEGSLKSLYYKQFIQENLSFNTLLCQKTVSYWNCYFRSQIPNFSDYCGYKLLKDLGIWQTNVAPRLIKHYSVAPVAP